MLVVEEDNEDPQEESPLVESEVVVGGDLLTGLDLHAGEEDLAVGVDLEVQGVVVGVEQDLAHLVKAGT